MKSSVGTIAEEWSLGDRATDRASRLPGEATTSGNVWWLRHACRASLGNRGTLRPCRQTSRCGRRRVTPGFPCRPRCRRSAWQRTG